MMRDIHHRWLQAGLRASLVFGLLAVPLFVDPPFVMYCALLQAMVLGWLIVQGVAPYRRREIGLRVLLRRSLAAGVACMLCWLFYLQVARFEVDPHVETLPGQLPLEQLCPFSDSIMFWRIVSPGRFEDFYRKVHGLHIALHGEAAWKRHTREVEFTGPQLLWSANWLRWWLLSRFLEDAHRNDQRTERKACRRTATQVVNSNRSAPAYFCVIEGDVLLVDPSRFERTLKEAQPAVAHLQHFYGHRVFEDFNPGILCVSRASAASRYMRWVMAVMVWVKRKRWLRLNLHHHLLHLLHDRFVFLWDEQDGCTTYRKGCQWVHFTRPKVPALKAAEEQLLSDGDEDDDVDSDHEAGAVPTPPGNQHRTGKSSSA